LPKLPLDNFLIQDTPFSCVAIAHFYVVLIRYEDLFYNTKKTTSYNFRIGLIRTDKVDHVNAEYPKEKIPFIQIQLHTKFGLSSRLFSRVLMPN
jgi:hypothetical protein